MAGQTLVLAQVPDSVPCMAARMSKATLKQAANITRILKTKEK